MCGDEREGLELAVGAPATVGPDRNSSIPEWLSEIENERPSGPEIDAILKEHDARDARVGESVIMRLASRCSTASRRWLQDHASDDEGHRDELLSEALEIVAHDATFIGAKLHRALLGKDEYGLFGADDPIQNDWNGSAKVALISVERSEHAWLTIAQATGEATPATIARRLAELRREVEEVFPKASQFIRPGFDEPGQ